MKKHIVSDDKTAGSATNRRGRERGRLLLNAGCWALAGLALCLSSCVTRETAKPTTLKDAFKKDFYVGVAINRTIATSTAVRADNVNRNMEQVEKDVALVKEQFNQISPENDLKWALIHPEPGPDGYDFGPADAYVNFGLSNHMYIVGHTLVWHAQTPSWVFAGTNMPLPAAGAVVAAVSAPAVLAVAGVVLVDRAHPAKNCSNGCTTIS
jgi:hypothetical protein